MLVTHSDLAVVVQFDREASQTRDLGLAKARASRGSPRSFAAQRTLAQDDNRTAPLPIWPAGRGYCRPENGVIGITDVVSFEEYTYPPKIVTEVLMHCIAFVQATPTSPEIAILQLDSKEHEALHKDALRFVNEKQVFGKAVKSVEIAPAAKIQTGLVMMVHLPGCACAAYCDPI